MGKMKCRVFLRFAYITIYVRKRENKITIQTIHKTLHKPYILLILRVLRCVQFVLQTIHKLYTKPYIEPYTASVQNPTQNPARNLMLKSEKPFPLGRGWGRLLKSPSLQGGVGVGFQKSNNFEPFFSDSTLTFLTFGNTSRLPILPTRRIIFLCLPQNKIRGRQRKIRGRQILTGCASKSPILKGK